MTPTAYIVTPISTPPEKDGEYITIQPNNVMLEFQYGTSIKKWINPWGDTFSLPDETVWLRPLDLSTLLTETWDKGVEAMMQDLSKILCSQFVVDQCKEELGKITGEAVSKVLKVLGEKITVFPRPDGEREAFINGILNNEK